MDFLYSTQLTVPVIQIVALLFLSTVSLLFGKIKLALLINYLFTLYWGYFLNRDLVLEAVEGIPHFTFIYFGTGLLVALIALTMFLLRD